MAKDAQAATEQSDVAAWQWWYRPIGPVVVGNLGVNIVSSYRLHAPETQQLSYVSMAVDATPICYLCGVARGSRQPMTGRLATHPCNTTDILLTSIKNFWRKLETVVWICQLYDHENKGRIQWKMEEFIDAQS